MKTQFDSLLGFCVLSLTLFGTVMIYSTSAMFANLRFNDGTHFLTQHLLHLLIGFVMFWFGFKVKCQKWENKVPFLMVTMLLLLVAVLIPGIGVEVNGARRWIRHFGVGIQPAELLKIVLIFYVASYLERKQEVLTSFFRGISPNFIIIGIYLLLLLLQPDFGTAVLISLTVFLMIYAGGGKTIHMFGSLIAFSGLAAILIVSQSYRLRRLLSFLDPWDDPLDTGFQIIQSFIALGTGGWFGKGLGQSIQKLFFLPDAHTDFIFAIIGEELGFFRLCLLIVVFGVFIWRGYLIAWKTKPSFERHVAFGFTTMISLQIILNLFVVTGLLPTKGLPLPFISFGGTSLLVTLFMSGVLLNISGGITGKPSPLSQKWESRSNRNIG